MKVAIVTDDGHSVSPHFGRAGMYAVLTVEDGAVVARELRAKPSPHTSAPESVHDDGGSHTGPAAEAKHRSMVGPVADCACVIARGMGQGAHDHIVAAGLRPVITTLTLVDEAALACAAGHIDHHPDRLH